MRKVNWNNVKEAEDFPRPAPGGYLAQIVGVEDVEDKEYLRIGWDFAEGDLAGSNRATYDRAGFWPTPLFQSYKEKALPFFKAFKTALEESNRGYQFQEDHLARMTGMYIGVVLGEEEYRSNDGTVKTRLKVVQTRSVQAILDGDFKVPPRKKLAERAAPTAADGPLPWDDDGGDGPLPF